MRAITLGFVSLLAFYSLASAEQCSVSPQEITNEWITMKSPCISLMRQQIQKEVEASVQYLAMAAHFSKDKVNRPGFAKLFFDAASEEREHAMKLIEYFLMRGELTARVTGLVNIRPPSKTSWNNGAHALEEALNLEKSVTDSIRRVIEVCEDSVFNDYHLADYLTGDFLEEQYKGQRDLAGKASTLKKLTQMHEGFGEFLFDKKLLGMDV